MRGLSPKVLFVPAFRTLFRGSRLGLEEGMAKTLECLEPRLGFQLVRAPVVSSYEEASRVAYRAVAEGIELVVVGLVTFVTGEVLEPLLRLPIPKVLWAVPEVKQEGPLSQNALCGLNLALSLPYLKPPAKWLYGPAEERFLEQALRTTFKALGGLRVLRGARLLWLGGPPPGFAAFAEEPSTGASVERIELETLFEAWHEVPKDELEEECSYWRAFSCMADEALEATARLVVALRHLAQGYDGVALRDWPEIPERLGVVPSAALARLADEGFTFAPEGDLMGLLSQLVLEAVGGGKAILLDIVVAEGRALQLWHGGEAPASWAKRGFRLVPHFNRGLPAVRDMTLKRGPVSGLRLFRGKAVLVEGELTGQGGYTGSAGWVTRVRWNGEPLDPQVFLQRWLGARVPHHIALGQGRLGQPLREALAWAGVDLAEPEGEVWGASWQ